MLRRVIMLALFLIGSAVVVTKAGTPSKAKSTEKRVGQLVGRLTTLNGDLATLIAELSAAATTTNGLANGTISGSSGTNGLTDGTVNGISGGASAGTAHTHGSGSYAVANGTRNHGGGSYAVN